MFSSLIEYKSVNKKRVRETLFFMLTKEEGVCVCVYIMCCICVCGERVLEMLTKKYKK